MPFGLAHGPIKPNRIRFYLISTFHFLFIVSQMQCTHLMAKIIVELPNTHLSRHSNAKNCVHYTNTCLCLYCCWRIRWFASMHTSKTHYGGNFTCSRVYTDTSKLPGFALVVMRSHNTHTENKKVSLIVKWSRA